MLRRAAPCCRYEACKGDHDALCKDVKLGGGRVQACLVRMPRRAAPRPPILRLHLLLSRCHCVVAAAGDLTHN